LRRRRRPAIHARLTAVHAGRRRAQLTQRLGPDDPVLLDPAARLELHHGVVRVLAHLPVGSARGEAVGLQQVLRLAHRLAVRPVFDQAAVVDLFLEGLRIREWAAGLAVDGGADHGKPLGLTMRFSDPSSTRRTVPSTDGPFTYMPSPQ